MENKKLENLTKGYKKLEEMSEFDPLKGVHEQEEEIKHIEEMFKRLMEEFENQ